jgi:hypothetical protein
VQTGFKWLRIGSGNRFLLILVSHFHILTVYSFLQNYMFQPNVAIIRFEYMFEVIALGQSHIHSSMFLNVVSLLSQCCLSAVTQLSDTKTLHIFILFVFAIIIVIFILTIWLLARRQALLLQFFVICLILLATFLNTIFHFASNPSLTSIFSYHLLRVIKKKRRSVIIIKALNFYNFILV